MELLTVDVPAESAGKVIELVGTRRGEMKSMDAHGNRQLLEFIIPTRGTIGIRSKIMTASAGEAIVAHIFDHYAPCKGDIVHRLNGVLVSMGAGDAIPYAIDALQQRGKFFVPPNMKVYEGMIVAEHCKEGDLVVNLQKSKQLTNVRSASSDRSMKIAPHRKMSLEETLEYIADDELVEVTPDNIRMRKRYLTELERKRNK
jgi:GTP-binding protein